MDDSYIFSKDNKKIYNINNSIDIYNTKLALQYCSQYFSIGQYNNKHIFNYKYLIIQSFLLFFLYWFFNDNIIIFFYKVDTTYNIIIFITNYFYNNNNIIYQPKLYIRYIYYFFVLALFYFINLLTLFYLYDFLNIITYIFLLPTIIDNLIHTYKFKKIIKKILDYSEEFLYFIISKKIVKIIIYISTTSLDYKPNINKNEFKNYVKKISISNFINFLLSFIYVSILHYLERKGKTFYTIIFRQYYFKQIYIHDKSYIIDLIKKKNWIQLLDPYTLDVLINHYLKLNNNSNVINTIKQLKKNILFSYSKIIFLWSFSSIININGSGILLDTIFLEKIDLKKYIIIYIFFILSYNSYDQLLYLIFYELSKNILTNNFFIDLIYDIFNFIKN